MRKTSILLGLGLLLPLGIYLGIYFRYRLAPSFELSSRDQSASLAFIRSTLDGVDGLTAPGKGISLPGPTWTTLYSGGELAFRHRCPAKRDLATCLTELSSGLRRDPALKKISAGKRKQLRIRVDISTAEGPIVSSIPLIFSKSVVPGLDGVGISVSGRSAYLLPDDLFRKQLMASYRPFFFMHEFRTGLDPKAAINLLAEELDLSVEQWRSGEKRWFRFRVQSFVDDPAAPGRALEVKRSRVPARRIDRAVVRQAVVRAADYVLQQIRPDGRFEYIYYPLDNTTSFGGYSLPRHAGTTWFLSLAYRTLRAPRFKKGAERAIQYLAANAVPKGCQNTPYACIGSEHHADLGSAALGIVAIAEYQRATGDKRYDKLARRLGRFIMMMQKPSGDFCHQYRPEHQRKNCDAILLYYTGESALALAKLQQITNDEVYVKPLQRAMDFLTGEKYDFFMGQFFISEDHWTCIAAEAASQLEKTSFKNHKKYAEFCYEFARLNGRVQIRPGEGLMEDLYGAFNITSIFMPHNTPAGSRTEANVATYLLSQRIGEPQPDILRTIRRSIRYLVDQQIRPESAWLMPAPSKAVGAMMQTPIRASVRIDYVQHAAAAMVRALPLIPERVRAPARK